jgi:hypothetical protein
VANLPPQLRQHLFDRAKERQITMQDLFALEERRRHSPDVPDGPWYKVSDRSGSAGIDLLLKKQVDCQKVWLTCEVPAKAAVTESIPPGIRSLDSPRYDSPVAHTR